MSPLGIIPAVVVAVIAAIVAYFLGRRQERARQRREIEAARDSASRIRIEAESAAAHLRRTAELEAKESTLALREAWKEEENRRRTEVERGEGRLLERLKAADRKSDQLDLRQDALDRRTRELEERSGALKEDEFRIVELEASARKTLERERAETEEELAERRAGVEAELATQRHEVQETLERARSALEELAGLSAEEARARIVIEVTEEARAEAANRIREVREEAERTAEREARKIVATAIQRMAADETAQLTVSVVQLPSDEMKGRIIGREGRNIRAFEQATGIDVIVDDTPEAVVLSGYNPIRREIARMALSRLIEDGRIHPARIEEAVAKASDDLAVEMREAAEETLYGLGIHGVHSEIVKVLGNLKFRTSFGQNQLAHAREVALLAGNMAAEMGLDVQLARRAGVLHDVGKGLTHEQELSHVELGHRLCKRHKEHDLVLNAILAHHDEEPHRYPEAWLVTAADAISGSRPGARREMFDGYVKRLEKLEEIATAESGVERCYAIQAGRELRVLVRPSRVSDAGMARISEAVARRIESELQYPGQIKVVVIRETRAIDFAR